MYNFQAQWNTSTAIARQKLMNKTLYVDDLILISENTKKLK